MESKGDESSYQCSETIKPSSYSHDSSRLTISILPPELMTKILLKLPVKFLLQLRCVSKSWCSLISGQEFIKTHLGLSTKNEDYNHHKLMWTCLHNNNLKVCSVKSLLCESVIEASDLDCPMKDNCISFEIVGSVNGLICLSDRAKELFIWNPTIRKYKKLPDSRPRLKNTNNFTYGFGFDELHDDYKVVGIFCLYENCLLADIQVKIYSLSNDSWRSMDDFQGWLQFVNPSKFINGKLHWATANGLTKYNDSENWDIISVDMADEKWEQVEKPSCVIKDFGLRLGELGNQLSILCNYRSSFVDLWVMKEYGVKESWEKMYTIRCPIFEKYVFLPSLSRSNKSVIPIDLGPTSMIYNPNDGTTKYAEITNFEFCVGTEIYIESLVCPISHTKKEAKDTVKKAAKTQMNDDHVPDGGSHTPSQIGPRRSSDYSYNED